MAQTKVQGQNINVVKTVDANGWTVYDYGNFKQYKKRGQTTVSVGASGWTSSYNAGGNLPVGMSTLGNNFVEFSGSTGDAAITVGVYYHPGATYINFVLTNQYGAALNNQTLNWTISITTP